MSNGLPDMRGIGAGVAAFVGRMAPVARLYFETSTGVQEPPDGRGRRCWVVSRGLCRFFKVPLLAEAPPARQLDALLLEIKRLSPFAETGSHFHLGADFAGVWLWDQEATRAAAQAIGVDVERMRVLPEPALLPGAEDGVRLIETTEGVEGQYWTNGSLAASRWWPANPDDRAWVLFQRGASVRPEGLVPTVPPSQRLAWLERPWTRMRRARTFDLARMDVRLVAAGIAAAFLIAYGYEGAKWWRLAADVHALTAEIAERSSSVEPILEARTRALDNLAAVQGLQRLDRFPRQLALMARVAAALPQDQTHLTAWTYDRGQLELEIAASQPLDVSRLVRTLENIEHFKAVAAERTGTNNVLRLHVTIQPL